MGKAIFTNESEPATPASGKTSVYVDSTSKTVKSKDDAGVVTTYGSASSPVTTKGDLYTYDTADARLGVGTNDQILIADSAEATGLKWGANTTVDQMSAAAWHPTDTNWRRYFNDFLNGANFSAGFAGGNLALIPSGTITSNTLNVSDGLAVGTYRAVTSTTATAGFYMERQAMTFTDNVYRVGMRFKLQGIPDGTDSFACGIGFNTGFMDHNGANGVFCGIDYAVDNTNFIARSSASGTDTDTSSAIAFTTNWHNVELILDAGAGTPDCKYYVDGNLIATHTTNIPTTGDPYYQGFINPNGTMSQTRYMDCDWLYLNIKSNTARGVIHTWE